LQVPKTTKLALQQAQREREQSTAMHRAFQRDLVKMRLATARAYVKVLTDGQVGCWRQAARRRLPGTRGTRAARDTSRAACRRVVRRAPLPSTRHS
jgi:hypothetical protein